MAKRRSRKSRTSKVSTPPIDDTAPAYSTSPVESIVTFTEFYTFYRTLLPVLNHPRSNPLSSSVELNDSQLEQRLLLQRLLATAFSNYLRIHPEHKRNNERPLPTGVVNFVHPKDRPVKRSK